MMDWYFGHDASDLVVPEDRDYFDRLPSPDSWLQWGTCGSGNYSSPNNFAVGKTANFLDENPQQQLLFGKDNKELNQLEEECSYVSRIDPMDDIFLYRNSLLQDNIEGLGSSKCLGTPSSLSDDSGNGLASLSNLSYGNSSEHSNGPSVQTKDMVRCDQEGSRISKGEDFSIEESVLQVLEGVLRQLSDKTRLCFRDSLYRLAQHSKQQLSMEARLDGVPLNTPALLENGDDGQTRSERRETAEQETNTIDRAVANLMFNEVDTNGREILPAMSLNPSTNHAAMGACNQINSFPQNPLSY